MWSTTWWRCGWRMKSSSRFSLVRILPTSGSKSGPEPSSFCRFFFKTELSLRSRAHFADLIFQKLSWTLQFLWFFEKSSSHVSLVHILSASSWKKGPRPSVFLKAILWNRAIPRVSCTFCRPLSRIEARNRGNRDPVTAATTDGHCTRKNAGFCARECFQAWIHALPIAHFPTIYLMMMMMMMTMMMMMMMWLTWWRGSHADVVDMMVRQLAVTMVRKSEVS